MSIDTTKIVRNIKIGDKYMPVPTPAGASTLNGYLNKTLVEIKKEDLQGVTVLYNGFSSFPNLKKITISNSLRYLPRDSSFAGDCPNLKSLIFEEPCQITELPGGNYTDFVSGTKLLKKLVIPDSVQVISSRLYAQYGEYLKIGTGITALKNHATTSFGYYTVSDKKMLTFICEAITPPTWNGEIGYGKNKEYTSIYVPDASVEAYKVASNWSDWADVIFPLSTAPAEPADEI